MLVESIVEHRGDPKFRKQVEFRVRWAGYDDNFDSWLPYKELRDNIKLDEYIQREIGTHKSLKHLLKR
jgi:hypothetical protein